MAHAMRDAAGQHASANQFTATVSAAFEFLSKTETLAAASAAMSLGRKDSDTERLFNGRLIAALTALSAAAGNQAHSRNTQTDVVLLAAALAGLAMLRRTGRLEALGFSTEEMLNRVEAHFSSMKGA
jgi:hypothetical protein